MRWVLVFRVDGCVSEGDGELNSGFLGFFLFY